MSDDGYSKALRLLGLAKRGGHAVSGRTAVELAIKRDQCKLVIVAEDAADRTIRQMSHAAAAAGIPLLLMGDTSILGQMTGSAQRSVAAITEEGLAAAIINAVDIQNSGEKP